MPHFTSSRRMLIGLAVVAGLTLPQAAGAAATPAPGRPTAKTAGASAITYESATLGGTVDPSGLATTYFFQYGPTKNYAFQSLPAGIAPGRTAVSAKTPVTGLSPVTSYHFRIVAVNSLGTAVGADETFTTAKLPLALSLTALPSPVVFGSPVNLVGALTGTGAAGRAVALQANPYPFTQGFGNVGNQEVASATGTFIFTLASLPLTTQFRVVSAGAGQAVLSSTVTETVELGVTMHVTSRRIHSGAHSLHFTGLITPAEVGARVSVQRLVGSRWMLVTATSARPAGTGSSSYSATLHRRHGGFYRVYVSPVEGGHAANFSKPLLVHVA